MWRLSSNKTYHTIPDSLKWVYSLCIRHDITRHVPYVFQYVYLYEETDTYTYVQRSHTDAASAKPTRNWDDEVQQWIEKQNNKNQTEIQKAKKRSLITWQIHATPTHLHRAPIRIGGDWNNCSRGCAATADTSSCSILYFSFFEIYLHKFISKDTPRPNSIYPIHTLHVM